jgi:outer membrane protein TolC
MTQLNLDTLNNALDSFYILSNVSLNTLNTIKKNVNYDNEPLQPFSHYYESLLQNNPKLSQLKTSIEIAQKSVALTQAQYQPYLSAQAGYEYTQNYTPVYIGRTYESGVFAGLSAVLPLYTGGRNDTSTQKAIANIQCEITQKNKAEKAMYLNLQQKYRLLLSTRAQIEASRNRVKSLFRLYEQGKIKTEIGKMLPVELNN